MLVEVWREVEGEDYSTTCCAVCGNNFDLGSVFAVALSDRGC
jgi:hypothetical protein